ncbi:LacI family DNA-binding transcriptional regulator [Lactiplantibacillus pentosus]|uniref:LacI family DNA-binding transcriptional regulator n=1 Tax=Lactiplantibacillus pentosus TaxID=1589 RepID=UPI000D01E722|nr:LacI family DNA-binding transcriptional regulator [Lactiplantibacillus pentosus]MCC3164306.1 LacI family DNA-binding transcriptional regulator [Lactiplantibacillus pentosus]MCJ8189485.1 LacI family DNA-binding transcriptional regulator [Lactiplantibacillus pentosus]PRO82302.1 LacI family transcriptional regulator [Lactiplantibacillus pentosus]
MTIKMEDIARLANVSRSAVSLALNGKEGVSEETRNRIFKVIDKYNYQPLRKRNQGNQHKLATVNFLAVKSAGLVNSNFRTLPFFDSLISALSEHITEFGGNLQIQTVESDKLAYPVSLSQSHLSGTIVLGTDLSEQQVQTILANYENVVFIDTYYPNITADFVTMDNYQGAYAAGEHIIKQGYQNIGYVASNKLISNFNYRRKGFDDALRKHGLEVNNGHFYTSEPTELRPEGLDIDKIMARDAPDVIFCEDDYIAIRLLKSCLKAKIKVPEELAIMGFDDIYEAQLLSPELSTVHVDTNQIAIQALSQLQGQVCNTTWSPQKTLIATQVVERASL